VFGRETLSMVTAWVPAFLMLALTVNVPCCGGK
jgi:hypothetical protein